MHIQHGLNYKEAHTSEPVFWLLQVKGLMKVLQEARFLTADPSNGSMLNKFLW